MGKRVTVKQPSLPTISVPRLRDPQERTYKLAGVLGPLVAYAVLIGGLAALPGVFKKGAVDLLAWLVLGLVVVVFQALAPKSVLRKRYPRSKVTGSAHQELKLMVNQQCRLLDIKQVPELYVLETNELIYSVQGLFSPYIVLSTRLLQELSPRELEVWMGTLLGQVKAKTYGWRTFITSVRKSNGFSKIICLPFLIMVTLMADYLEVSNHVADRIGLLLIGGDYKLMAATLIKVLSYSSSSLTDQARRKLQGFVVKGGVEARAEDVEQQMVLHNMLRAMPGLKERLDAITHAEQDKAFDEELGKMEQRMEKLQPGR